MLRTMSHEMIHMAKQMSPGYFERYSDFIFDNFLSENADELIFRRQRQYEKANNGKKLSYNEAMEEVVADASEMFLKGFLGLKVELGNQAGEGRVDMETVTEDLQKPKYKGVLRVLGNVIERMKRKISAFKRAWNGAQAKTEEGKTVSSGDAKAYEQAQQMFNELILRASANYKLLKDGKWESEENQNKASFRDEIRDILEMSDDEAKRRKAEQPYITVLNQTPDVVLNHVKGAKNLPVIIRFDAAYLSARSSGALDGNYHDLGADFTDNLYRVLSDPEAIIRISENRINLIATIENKKGNNSIVSVEMDTVKQIDDKYKAYNLVVTFFQSKDNYARNLIKKATAVEYEKENLSQVNPQLHNSLGIINDRSSKNSVSDSGAKVNTFSEKNSGNFENISEKSEKASIRGGAEGVRFALPETDSDGKLLSDGQRKYFNGTKVVDANGNLLRVYHGSPAIFTEFSYQFMSRNGSSEGQGIYFTQNKDMAEGYTKKGGQLLEGYLSIKKPLSDSEITLTSTEVKRLIQAVDPTGDDVLVNYDSAGGMGYPSKTWYNRALADAVSSCMEYCDSDSEILANIANSGAGAETVLLTAKRVLGYDGYIVDGKYENSTVYVAFASDQFKNADNRNPTDNPDIRYSERGNGYDGYAMSNNARDAYERGEMPLSRWTKQKVINQIAQDNGVSPEDVSLEFPYEHYLEKAGWHHTSSKYNKTYFYYVTDDTSGVIFSERAKEKIQSDKIEQVKKYLEENKENLKKAEAWKPEITEDDQYYYIRELDNRNGIYNKNYTTKEKVILRTEEKVQEKISYLKQRIENQEKQIRDLSNSENFRYSTREEEVDSEERKKGV